MKVCIIIPAFNEEKSIGKVVEAIPDLSYISKVIVVDNGSTDETSRRATEAGAVVLREDRKGYGYACLCGMEYLEKETVKPDVVVFLDGDFSDFPEEVPKVAEPVISGEYDLVIGSRVKGNPEKGSLTPQQIFGNALATKLIQWIYKENFSDLGPFRAIRYSSLLQLNMQDKTYGWTVEMQVKAAKHKLRCTEVAVRYRKRIGVSKVSGTLKGAVMAGYKILWTIFREWKR